MRIHLPNHRNSWDHEAPIFSPAQKKDIFFHQGAEKTNQTRGFRDKNTHV